MKALTKDILRTIGNGKKRFFSILVITALGVTMLTGLRASCNDLRRTADALFDEQKLFDIQVSSTLGLDEEDVAALETLDEALIVEGEYAESLYTEVEGVHEEVTVRTLGERMNIPTVLEGTLPTEADEVAVTEHYLNVSGKHIGDTLTFARAAEDTDEDDGDPVFPEIEYTITAEVIDPFDINNRESAVSFRAAATTAFTFFVPSSAAETDLYTSVYVYLKDTADLMCYSDEYKQIVQNAKNEINDTLKAERQQGRYEKVYGDALDEYNEAYDDAMAEISDAQSDIDDARSELEDAQTELDEGQQALDEAQQELIDGQREIDEGWAEVWDGQSQLDAGISELEAQERDAGEQIAEGQAQIDEGYAALDEAKAELDAAAQQLAEGETQLEQAEAALAETRADTLSQIDAGISQMETGREQIESGIDALKAQIAALEAAGDGGSGNEALITELNRQLAALETELAGLDVQLSGLETQRAEAVEQFDAAQREIDAQAAQLEAGRQEYEEGLAQWRAGVAELDAAQAELDEQEALARSEIASAWDTIYASEAELDDARQQLNEGQAELDDGRQQIEDSQQEIDDGQTEINDGWKEVNDGQQELDENREEALAELADARAEIDEIGMAKWYIQSRDSLSGYSNVASDAESIQSIGNFIPVIFFIVAILISLTAITRMVEEDRGLIGTYKALGFKNREIRRKYLIFAVLASVIGGVAGDFCGFVILPNVIFAFFKTMYVIPSYLIRFGTASGIIGILMFTVGILLAALYAVHGDMVQMPAALMRPSVPKGGTRIFLEYIPLLWKRLTFLGKVTARNLFRYKRRLLMTVIGIMGCTGLLVCSFGIKNTVTDLEQRQYGNIVRYDILAVATDDDKLLSYMDDPENIESYVSIEVDSMTINNSDDDSETVQVFVIPDDAPISEYIKLADVSGNEVGLLTDGVMVTRSIEQLLGTEEGDVVTMQDLSLNEAEFTVAMVTENYLGDMAYVSESCYEEAFGKEYEPNAVLIRLTESCLADDPVAYSNDLGARDGLLSTTSTQEMEDTYSQAFTIINIVVYVILVLAAALAFIVLFTLATTNISEREREIATIKVLGFFDREVYMYVNRETVILSCIGIGLGLPLGWIITFFLCRALKIPGIFFAVSVHPSTYVICAAIAVAFTLLVNQITNRILDRIDPAEALKSVE